MTLRRSWKWAQLSPPLILVWITFAHAIRNHTLGYTTKTIAEVFGLELLAAVSLALLVTWLRALLRTTTKRRA